MSTGKTYSTKYLLDSNNNRGAEGQVLSTTSTGIDWVDGSAIPGVPGGSGTVNTIPLWTPNGDTLGNSVMTQSGVNIGIGTTTYTNSSGYSTLNINGTTSGGGGQIAFQTSGSSKHFIWGNATDFNIYNGQTGPLIFYTGATERMRINASGNVGIGTTSPGSLLTLNGSGQTNNYSGVLRIYNTYSTGAWGHIGLPDSLSSTTNSNNFYLIGRANNYTDRIMSFHIPRDGDYGSGAQPKFGFYSTGSDLLHSIEAETGTSYFKGNVGIGTTLPKTSLDIVKDSDIWHLMAGGATKKLLVGGQAVSGDVVLQAGAASTPNNAAVTTAYNLCLQRDGGNVGIGTTSPSTKLTIGDPGGATTRSIEIEGNSSATGMNGFMGYFSNGLYLTNNYYYNSAQIHPVSTYGQTNIVCQTGTTTGSNYITFNISDHTDSNNAPDVRMRIMDSGNVGINTTNPLAKLVVNQNSLSDTEGLWVQSASNPSDGGVSIYKSASKVGSIGSLGSNSSLSFYTNASGSNIERMRINSSGNIEQGIVGTTASAYYYFNSTTTGDTGVIFRDNSSTNSGFFTYNHDTDSMKFGTGGSERMRITSAGGISFGSTGTAYGTSGQVLTSAGNASPTWTTPTTGTVTGSGSATQVAFWDGNTSLSGNNELYWDNTNGCLGINDTTPSSRLRIIGENSDTSIYTVDIKHERNDANVGTSAMRINMDLSGADTTTADRGNNGLLIDIDSSANGDASNEHRIYGVNSVINFTGFTDLARGGYFSAKSN
ncbi:MAG: hypothetical protein GY787_11095, partial [Alteromonadales bacterium]|nr:hypothetical protein [Alteromonadales bacterium]